MRLRCSSKSVTSVLGSVRRIRSSSRPAVVRVTPRQICLQAMRRKWASCSTKGTVSFSRELLRQPWKFRDEVIVHELVHLRVPNHGRLFKRLVAAILAR